MLTSWPHHVIQSRRMTSTTAPSAAAASLSTPVAACYHHTVATRSCDITSSHHQRPRHHLTNHAIAPSGSGHGIQQNQRRRPRSGHHNTDNVGTTRAGDDSNPAPSPTAIPMATPAASRSMAASATSGKSEAHRGALIPRRRAERQRSWQQQQPRTRRKRSRLRQHFWQRRAHLIDAATSLFEAIVFLAMATLCSARAARCHGLCRYLLAILTPFMLMQAMCMFVRHPPSFASPSAMARSFRDQHFLLSHAYKFYVGINTNQGKDPSLANKHTIYLHSSILLATEDFGKFQRNFRNFLRVLFPRECEDNHVPKLVSKYFIRIQIIRILNLPFWQKRFPNFTSSKEIIIQNNHQ